MLKIFNLNSLAKFATKTRNSLRVKAKICCIQSIEEAQMAIKMGAYALGLVGKMPSGPGPIDDETIAEIAKSVPSSIQTFLLTSETQAEEIIKHNQRTRTNTIQLVDRVTTSEFRKVRQSLPNIKLVQVIHVLNESSIQEALDASNYADIILLDSGNPTLSTKVLGGTGTVHN